MDTISVRWWVYLALSVSLLCMGASGYLAVYYPFDSGMSSINGFCEGGPQYTINVSGLASTSDVLVDTGSAICFSDSAYLGNIPLFSQPRFTAMFLFRNTGTENVVFEMSDSWLVQIEIEKDCEVTIRAGSNGQVSQQLFCQGSYVYFSVVREASSLSVRVNGLGLRLNFTTLPTSSAPKIVSKAGDLCIDEVRVYYDG